MGRNVSFYLNNYSTFLQTRLEMSKQYHSSLLSLSWDSSIRIHKSHPTCRLAPGQAGRRLVTLEPWMLKSGRVGVSLSLLILLFLFLVRIPMDGEQHSPLLFLLVCAGLSRNNSICSASWSMNYGWTPQPLNATGIYVDRAALHFITRPVRVTGSL